MSKLVTCQSKVYWWLLFQFKELVSLHILRGLSNHSCQQKKKVVVVVFTTSKQGQ